jgi:hypothetical protein
MRTKLGVIAGIGFLVAAGAMPLLAHHSFAAEFDAKSPVKVEGTVTRMQWTNPHSWVYIDTRKPDGTVENWAVEVGSPTVLFRRGFTRNSLPPGTKVVVEGYRAKDGSRRANGRDITLVDGKKLFVGSTGTGAPYELTPGSQTTK